MNSAATTPRSQTDGGATTGYEAEGARLDAAIAQNLKALGYGGQET